MSSLSEYKLHIPISWDESSENGLIKNIEESEGIEKNLLLYQTGGLTLIKDLKNSEVTPERLAWLNIWTKTITLLRSTITLLSEKSYYVLEVLERISLEYLLHIHTILDPILSIEEMEDFPYKTLDETEMTKLCLDKVFGRLCAYCAWGLWNDKELYEEILEPLNLDGIWNPNPVNEIVSDPQRNDFHENNF